MWESALLSAIWEFLKTIFGIKPNDPLLEASDEALKAKEREAAVMAEPDRDKSAIVRSLRKHEP